MSNNVFTQLTRLDLDRMKGYRELLDFYNGRQWQGRERRGERRLLFNYARVFVEKITSYLMGGISFAVDPAEDSDEARERARKAEAALYQVYEDNHLEQLDLETEIDCAARWAMLVTRLSGMRLRRKLRLPLPMCRAFMPGGSVMTLRTSGE